MNCNNCGTEFHDGVNFCSNCSEKTETIEAKKLGMKWHKFTAYFRCPIGAITTLISSIMFFSDVRQKLIDLIPDFELSNRIIHIFCFFNFESVKVLNDIYAFVFIAFSFYWMYISFALIKKKKGAPKHIYISLVSSLIVTWIYAITLMIFTRSMIEFNTELIISLIKKAVESVVSVVFWIYVNTKYYNKREYMFTK